MFKLGLALVLLLASVVSSTSNAALALQEEKLRDLAAFDVETKWNCFYRTTTPVKGLDPAIWRLDQFDNLLMAGLNYNCKGCLCYTFDHRYPISNLKDYTKIDQSVIDSISSIDNCQALSFRTNALKGSCDDAEVRSVIGNFGCDQKTMRLFSDKEYFGARVVQKHLLTEEKIDTIHEYYERYLTSNSFIDPLSVGKLKSKYFDLLNKKAAKVYEYIEIKVKGMTKQKFGNGNGN